MFSKHYPAALFYFASPLTDPTRQNMTQHSKGYLGTA
jgi:hypothetical protein